MIKVGDIYPITTIKYPDGSFLTVVLNRHLQEYTPLIKWESLMEQLRGQTASSEGMYPEDIEDWLNGKGVTD